MERPLSSLRREVANTELSDPNMKEIRIRRGDRCCFTDLGKSRSPRLRDKVGTVISVVAGSGKLVVLLDGNKNPTTYHKSYLQRLSE